MARHIWVAHGAETNDSPYRFYNDSWITGDQVYLIRVTPTIENINDASKYEFYAGKDGQGNPIWTNDLQKYQAFFWNGTTTWDV